MARIIKRRPGPAMIVALIALLLATAGTSYALTVSLRDFSKGARIQTLGTGPLVYSTTNNFLPANSARTLSATCPRKTEVVGGGVRVSPGTQVIEGVVDSYPTNFGWVATVFNSGTESHSAVVYAICAKTLRTRGTIGGFRSP